MGYREQDPIQGRDTGSMVAYTYNPSTWEVEARKWLQVQGQPRLYSEALSQKQQQ
jgi:hypothetical protein